MGVSLPKSTMVAQLPRQFSRSGSGSISGKCKIGTTKMFRPVPAMTALRTS